MTHRLSLRAQLWWSRLSLRQQLVVSLWLCTIPVSALGSTLVLRQTYQHAKAETRHTMAYNLATLAQVMNDWLGDNRAWLRQLADGPSLRKLDPASTAELLARTNSAFPNVDLSVYSRDGQLIASNDSNPPARTAAAVDHRRRSEWFQDALKGQPGLHLWQRSNGSSCLSQARAINNANRVIGVLQACTPPEEVAARSGVKALLDSDESDGSRTAWLDLEQGRSKGWGVLMLSNRDELLLLHKQGVAVTGGGRLTNPGTLAQSPWAELAQTIKDQPLNPETPSQSITNDYFVATSPLGNTFRLATVVDQATSLKEVRATALGIAAANLLALLISTIAIVRVSKPLLQPIDTAGEALRRISAGDFEITLPSGSNNDIGRLFGYITSSAQRLKAFVAEATRTAVNMAQIREAKRLQADFLIEQLPETTELEIAALCEPAYEIGADWYDAIPLGDARAVVVADVCDKGIPSALYMSVFRSLLRLSLCKEWENSQSCAASIGIAVSTVNRYMAETHGHTGMFATAFVAIVEPHQGTLTYVLAGHEPPLLQRADGSALCSLELSGPALGLFPQATFQIHTCELRPGDLLLAFSDGLPDSRNPAEEAFGTARIQHLLNNLDPTHCSAQRLLEQVRAAVEEHCSGAEQFDDLTLLALKRRETP